MKLRPQLFMHAAGAYSFLGKLCTNNLHFIYGNNIFHSYAMLQYLDRKEKALWIKEL